jgi:hypothetical protein
METVKITLCPPPCEPGCPPECPEVEITDHGVSIGEVGNLVRLTPLQWNDLVTQTLQVGMLNGSFLLIFQGFLL